MKKLFIVIALFASLFSCQKDDCSGEFIFDGTWQSFDSVDMVLTVNDTIAQVCFSDGYCVGSGYYVENESLVFAAGVWSVESNTCNSAVIATPEGMYEFFRVD